MRDLRRNRQPVWYAQFLGEQPILDDEGNDTGETGPSYSEPAKAMLNISPSTGNLDDQLFGNLVDYTHIISTTRKFPIDEQTVLWVDTTTERPFDFKVVQVAKSPNGWRFALKAVSVSG